MVHLLRAFESKLSYESDLTYERKCSPQHMHVSSLRPALPEPCDIFPFRSGHENIRVSLLPFMRREGDPPAAQGAAADVCRVLCRVAASACCFLPKKYKERLIIVAVECETVIISKWWMPIHAIPSLDDDGGNQAQTIR